MDNKNIIKDNNNDIKFTVPLIKASQNRLINEHRISGYATWTNSFYKILSGSYSKAPNFDEIMHLLNILIDKNDDNISTLATNSVLMTAEYLEIKNKTYHKSSDLEYLDGCKNGADKILSICGLLKATHYHNPIGGLSLYDNTKFLNNGIELLFVDSFKNELDNVYQYSIIDLLMWKSKEEMKELLLQYSVLKNGE